MIAGFGGVGGRGQAGAVGGAAVRRAGRARHARHAHVHGQAAGARARARRRHRPQGQDGAAAARAARRPPTEESPRAITRLTLLFLYLSICDLFQNIFALNYAKLIVSQSYRQIKIDF